VCETDKVKNIVTIEDSFLSFLFIFRFLDVVNFSESAPL